MIIVCVFICVSSSGSINLPWICNIISKQPRHAEDKNHNTQKTHCQTPFCRLSTCHNFGTDPDNKQIMRIIIVINRNFPCVLWQGLAKAIFVHCTDVGLFEINFLNVARACRPSCRFWCMHTHACAFFTAFHCFASICCYYILISLAHSGGNEDEAGLDVAVEVEARGGFLAQTL